MPRKAAAELAVVPLVPGQGRPEPPTDLDVLEQGVWRDVVAALPGHWIDPAGAVVLRRLVAQAAVAERQEMRLRRAADYGPPITNEQAKAAASAAVAEAKKNNSPVAIAIVGPAGELVYFEKMDGTPPASVGIAQGKARTAVLFRRHSKAFADQYGAGNRAFTTFPETPVASEDGVPIVVNGKIIGAIGASGTE